jgi:TolA-binding protein
VNPTGSLGDRAAPRFAGAMLLLLLPLASCAYYNTFYKAKDYYFKATLGAPYAVEKPDASSINNFNKAIEYSKKLMAIYPKSKWVDDAYLMWARSLVGKDDPLETMNMLRDFPTRYPNSPLKDEALFYLGVGGRKARKYTEALASLDEFLKRAPRHELAPYALIERAQVLVALQRPGEAAASATEMLQRFPKSEQRDRALLMRAEALLAQGDPARARGDFKLLGTRAATDEQRFGFLLREADCLEAERRYDDDVTLLQAALAHEQEPRKQGGPLNPQPGMVTNATSVERWGQLMVRIGTAHALAGRKDLALESYRRVVAGFTRTPLAAEAQFRVAYVYETMADDFETARQEYAKVQTHSPASPFTAQATVRLGNLTRLSQYRSGAGPDSASKKAEAGFMLAELYLFQLDKPDRALEEYRKIANEQAGTPHAGKALNAEAWLLRNKLGRPLEADSVLWVVVKGYPKTEAQVDARDYLERYGHRVPPEMIQLPEKPSPPAPDTTALSRPPARADSIGVRRMPAGMDSLLRLGIIRAGDQPAYGPGVGTRFGPDSLRRHMSDTLSRAPALPDTGR